MKQGIFEIKSNIALTATVYKMVLVGDTSAITCPGQFVNILLDGLFLRRPISVNDCVDNELTLIYKVVGKGTEQMAKMTAGQTLDVLTGLGNGYDLTMAGDRPLLIGGAWVSLPCMCWRVSSARQGRRSASSSASIPRTRSSARPTSRLWAVT